ncbi:MAG: chemotaxis protein CheB [Azoarcus sp.]|nr:chemotaxis protein CheB [Azoarcus sp.]
MTKRTPSPATPSTDAVPQSAEVGTGEKIILRASGDAAFCIAAIGASAGGLDAICEFFEAMPATGDIAFVVIQHLYPTQKSLAAEIIGKHTAMPTVAAANDTVLVPGHIYTIPANTYPSLQHGRLHFEPPTNTKGPRLPIDHFFSSLGDDQHERAIGIILSGSGTDGSQGLRSIEANGGIVLAQAPETAQFDSMPRSAIGTGLVNSVLPVAAMPTVLLRYAQHDYVAQRSPASVEDAGQQQLEGILRLIHTRRGYNFSGYKHNTLIRRIRRRMGLRSINELSDYQTVLEADPQEANALFKDLLIGVTEFFRDPEAWQQLRKLVIAPLVESKCSGEPIRVWVPACSTGEEAYTVAILILEELRQAEKPCPLMVFATDANEGALHLGRLGSYPSGIAMQVPPEYLHPYFVESSENHHFQVGKALRDCVIFGEQNVMTDPPFSRVDLVCCRNLLIYLESEAQQELCLLFHFALLPNGFLFLGTAETVGKQADIFAPISKKWRIFRRLAGYKPADIQLPIRGSGKTPVLPEPIPPTAQLKGAPRPAYLARINQQVILEQFAPASVLVNSRFEALYFSGPTENYLQMPRGTPTHDLLAQARDGLRSRLGSALKRALSSDAPVIVDNARVRREGRYQPVRLSVLPIKAQAEESGQLLMVVFQDQPQLGTSLPGEDESRLVSQLEAELSATKDDLRSTIESLETSNEELKVSNEEVVSINEELQSINEELESSKEELQSLNEELITVNQQLQAKVVELEGSNTDLRNLLSCSEIATICLDRELRIKWFTPSMKGIGSIIAGDVGRSITDFSTVGLGNSLIEDIAEVLRTKRSKQRDFKSQDEQWYLRRITPYRTDPSHVNGVVVTYSNITESRRSSDQAETALRAMATSLEERVRERTVQLRTLMAELALSEDRERRMLARDLHDDLGQVLAIVKIKLTSLEGTERRGALKGALKEIETLVDQGNRSVRSLMLHLNPPVLDTLGLVPALEWLSEEMERLYGLAVRVGGDDSLPMLEEPARTTIFRAVRELLINVARHADTNRADVDCKHEDDTHIAVTVTDYGCGFDYEKALSTPAGNTGFGLISVRERIEFIGGEMIVISMPGDGTTITIRFPAKHGHTFNNGGVNGNSDLAGGRSQDTARSTQDGT